MLNATEPYWRRLNKFDLGAVGKGEPDLFDNTSPLAWHGKHRNVFCVDFSVGARWAERKAGTVVGQDFKLAALRWPSMCRLPDSLNEAKIELTLMSNSSK